MSSPTAGVAVQVPAPRYLALLAVAVLAVSTSAPIIAACAAPALAIAMWRCLLGGLFTAGWVGFRERASIRALDAVQWRACLTAGALLAAHFATWIPSLRFTSVASSTALVATQPVWAALLARFRGVPVAPMVWVGILVSLGGVLVLTGIDFALDPRSLIGNGLALVGAMLAAAYVSVGERVRRSVPTGSYTLLVYVSAGAALLLGCLALQVPLWGFATRDWLLILALTVVAQLLGHTLINLVLAHASATVVSLAILFELPGAVIIAALWLGLLPPLAVLPALLLIMAGLALVIRSAAGSVAELPLDPP